MLDITWRRSTACLDSEACVEVGHYAPGAVLAGWILVRDSKDPDGPVLEFTPEEWSAFLTGVRNGEFDRP